ncbi:MAG TPA: hypothetical protein VFC19_00570 [Candidatus Limnocylindrales bacterium]|nr:hypothetical protein [Candidatus Limnocylindrales bacterium]
MGNELELTYVLLSRDVSELLADNHSDLATLMTQQDPPVACRPCSDPAFSAQGSKDLSAVLVSAAVLAAGLTPLLLRLIGRLTSRPVLVTELVLVPVEDSSGVVVQDADSQPVLYWAERVRFVEPSSDAGPFSVSVQALGVRIDLGNPDNV